MKDEIKDKIIEKQDEALSILDELITFHDCQVNGEDWNKLYNKGQKLRKQLASLKSQLSEAGEEKIDLKKYGSLSGGWECPRCHKIHSWMDNACDCPPKTYTFNTCEGTNKPR